MICAWDLGQMSAHRVDGAVKGLINVVGSMVETGHGQDVFRSRKVVRAVQEDIGGRVYTLQDCNIATKTN